MKKIIALNCFLLISKLLVCCQVPHQKVSLEKLHQYGDAFNIEGGKPACLLRKNQIWLNLAAVLDRPLIDGKTLQEITESNTYPLKESSIESYNEAKVNLAFLLTALHYLQHGHTFLNKDQNQDITLTLQIHRGSSGIKQMEIFKALLATAVGENTITKNPGKKTYPGFLETWYFPDYKTNMEFRIGYEKEYIGHYKKSDILFSFGIVGGLNPEYPSSSLLVSDTFIPYDVDTHTVTCNKTYHVDNHLLTQIDSILKNPRHAQLVEMINSRANFLSPNPAKKELKACTLQPNDFKKATLFQITKLFNPTDKSQEISIINSIVAKY